MHSNPSLRSSARVVFEMAPVLVIDDGPFSSFPGRLSNASSFQTSLLQAIEGAMPAGSVSSSSTFVQQFPLTLALKTDVKPLTHASLGFPFHCSVFVSGALNLWFDLSTLKVIQQTACVSVSMTVRVMLKTITNIKDSKALPVNIGTKQWTETLIMQKT